MLKYIVRDERETLRCITSEFNLAQAVAQFLLRCGHTPMIQQYEASEPVVSLIV